MAPANVAEGGLVWMLLVKVLDGTQVHNVLSRNPGFFLRTIALPVDEVLAAADVAHSIGHSPSIRQQAPVGSR